MDSNIVKVEAVPKVIYMVVSLGQRVGYVSAPPIRRRRFGAGQFGAGHFGAGTIRRQNFFL